MGLTHPWGRGDCVRRDVSLSPSGTDIGPISAKIEYQMKSDFIEIIRCERFVKKQSILLQNFFPV